MQAFWDSIPAPIRTIINVAFAALLTWAATDGLDQLAAIDLPTWAKGLLVAVATAVVRALNPLDSGTPGYGIGTSSAGGQE